MSEIQKDLMEKLMEVSYELNFRMNLRVNSKPSDIHDKCAAEGLSPVHVAALAIAMRQSKEPMLSFIADKLRVSYATMTNIADKLEKLGYLVRKKDDLDRRAIRVSVTKQAFDFMRSAMEHHRSGLEAYMGSIDKEDRKKLTESFDNIYKIVMKYRSKNETCN